MKPIPFIMLFLTGCASVPSIPTLTTAMGIQVQGQTSGVSFVDLDNSFVWAQQQGLKLDPHDLHLIILEGQPTPQGNFGIWDGVTWFAGKVISDNPWTIQLIRQNPENLRHELIHVMLQQTTGNADAGHQLPIWKTLGVF